MFTLLDVEVESRRLVYDTGLHKGDIWKDYPHNLLPTP